MGLVAVFAIGCGDSVPQRPESARPKADPAMAESRIQQTMNNPALSPAQKQQIIDTIKQRNNLK